MRRLRCTMNTTDLSNDHDGEVIKYALAELRIICSILHQPFHGGSHFYGWESGRVTWAKKVQTSVLTSLKRLIEFRCCLFEALYSSLFFKRLLSKGN